MSKKSLISFIFALLLIFIYQVLISLPYPFSSLKQTNFSIRKGESLKEISVNLAKQKIIISPFLFNFYLRLNRLEREIKASDYLIDLPISLKSLVYKITTNNVDNIFLIKEGETLKEIEKNLKDKGIIDSKDDISSFKLKDFSEFVQTLSLEKYLDKPLEGFFYPDSYHLPKGMKTYEIVNIFLDNFLKKIDFELTSKEKDLYEIITLASIIEKEVRDYQEKRIVADILSRRLKAKMLLQVDATICYALSQEFYNCQLKQKDFKIDSLYNTYLYQGLPPTPISNPSKETIEAVLNPLENDYWYYLTNRQTGDTIFSKTYEEHKLAREKYLK